MFDVINSLYNSPGFSKHLDNLQHPILEAEEAESEDDDDTEIAPGNRTVKSSRRGTVFIAGAERTRASAFNQKLASISKFAEMGDLLENEFEKMILYISEFADN